MNLLIGLLAQLMHIALMAATAPAILSVQQWLDARLAGQQGPPLLQTWRDFCRLARKQPVSAEGASQITDMAPLVATAAIAVAACLVPSFSLGMTFGRFADVLVIGGLLALARCSLALAAMDAGSAWGGIGASRTMLLACGSDAALLLVAFIFGLLAGSINIDLISAIQQEAGLHGPVPAILALASIVPVAMVDAGVLRRESMTVEFSGFDLALIELAGALRLLVWFDLLGALFLPFGMVSADGGPLAWLVGLICWLARVLVFMLALGVLRALLGRMRLTLAARMLGVSVVLAVLAVLFLFAGMTTA